ncbi:hypothetical protein LCGC14_0376900 [marine sediment metagenome]|uniref:Bacteriophage head to tail connecting protein n=1 Tax=marine sediment metagenome TaxID=412755 RepID=A0A0F9T9G6_9ZZZZ
MIDPRTIIDIQKNLEDGDSTFRSNWQDQANYIFPRESNITEKHFPGSVRKFDRLYDTTGVTECERMTTGMLTEMVPAGQKFFSLTTSGTELQELDVVKSYMARSTEVLHEELFASNFILQLKETLQSLIAFGTGCIFDSWRDGLYFMDWDISRYQILENFQGKIDTLYLKFPKTAKQAFGEWGDFAGESVLLAMKDEKKQNQLFWFIHVVRPRQHRNPRLEDSLNMAWESGYVNIKDKIVVEEGGFPEFPYQVPRWSKTSGEVHGRGIGHMILPQVKMVNANKRDFNEMTNKIVNPHREVLESFEGEYDTTPGARNNVMELPSSRVDERNFGNFPVGKDSLTMERQVIKDAFFHDAFAPLTDLSGDRRNELEIRQRIQEAFRRIGAVGRIEAELFTPLIVRSFNLLVRNGVIPPPPPELQGQNLKVVYMGPLSLAQQNAEVTASQQWVGLLAETAEALPGVMDNVDADSTARRWGRVLGVNEEDIASEEDVQAKREARQDEARRNQALEAAKIAGDVYGKTQKAPEEGSGAEQMGVV